MYATVLKSVVYVTNADISLTQFIMIDLILVNVRVGSLN